MNDADPGLSQAATEAKRRTTAIFDRAAASYDQVGVEFFSVFGQRLVEVAGLGDGDRVLDVGCGRGAVLFPAARAVGDEGSVVGIDLSPAMAELCAAEIQRLGVTNAQVRLGDAEAPDVGEASFDAVLGGLVIFFLPDPGAALDAYRSTLVPGGRLALSTFGPEDQRFAPVFGAVAAHVPVPDAAPSDGPSTTPTTPARAQENGPFSSTDSITELLSSHGFTDIAHVEETYDVRFTGGSQWIDWSWSHGARALWEMVPEDRRAAAHDDAIAALDALTPPDGPLVHEWALRYTTALAGTAG